MIQRKYLILRSITLGTICLLSSLNADEHPAVDDSLGSQVYLSLLESKIEEMRHQLQDQQKNHAKIEESLAQIRQFSGEIQSLKEKIQKGSKEDLLAIVQKVDSLTQQKNELLQSHEEVLASLNEKATKEDVEHSFHEMLAQIERIQRSLELRPSHLQVDAIEQLLTQAERDIKQLKLDFQEVSNQRVRSEVMEQSFKLLSSQIVEVNQYLKKVHFAWVDQTNRMQTVEQQQQELIEKKIPPIQDKGWRAYAEFLYWKNIEPNLNYAISQTPPSNSRGSLLDSLEVSAIGSIKSVSYGWDPGFRVGMGYQWGVDCWDLYLEYTRLRNKGTDSHTRSGAGTVAPYNYLKGLFVEFLSSGINQVESNATLTYNVWDIVLQRPFYETASVVMRFLTGVRGTAIEQYWKSSYQTASTIAPYEAVKNKWHFGGAGPRVGINFEWLWNYGLGCHFQTSGGLIWGHFKNKQSIMQIDQLSMPNFIYQIGKIQPENGRIIPTVEMVLGLKWEKRWKSWGFQLFADWEFNSWVDLNETYYFPASAYNQAKVGSWLKETVSLQGLTLGAMIQF